MKYLIFILAIFLVACSPQVSYKTEDVQALAQTVKPEDIIIYTVPDCMYCNQAKAWLKQNNFAFTDCDMSISQQCQKQFDGYGGNGTPLVVIKKHGKQHIMTDGFDSDELMIALQGKN